MKDEKSYKELVKTKVNNLHKMFTPKFRHFCLIPDKVIIRTLRNVRRLNLPERKIPDNNKHSKLLKLLINPEKKRNNKKQYKDDFFKRNPVFNEYDCTETLIGKYEKPYQIDRDVYFNTNMPNFLMWSEKELIRDLAKNDPNEWTPKRIAESFPVTEEAVKNLLAYPWKQATKIRINRHDATAKRNWRELKEKTISIPEELRLRLLHFADRVIPPLKETSVINEADEKKEVNTEELKEIVLKFAKSEKEFTDTKNDIFETTKVDNTIKIKKEKVHLISSYPERIRIRKGFYKKGTTYKVGDCFYDDDGKFLYRVIS